MFEQLGAWHLVVLTIVGAILAIPWVYGLAAAIKQGYKRYFELVVELFGVEPWPEPPRKDRADGDFTEVDEA